MTLTRDLFLQRKGVHDVTDEERQIQESALRALSQTQRFQAALPHRAPSRSAANSIPRVPIPLFYLIHFQLTALQLIMSNFNRTLYNTILNNVWYLIELGLLLA